MKSTTEMFPTFRRCWRWGGRVAALLFVLQAFFIVAGPPHWLTDWLKATDVTSRRTPAIIVVLGGGGIPSESGLIRCYYAAKCGVGLTGVTYVVSLPADDHAETNSVGRMRDELVMRGVPASQIRMESRGVGTHDQAVKTRGLLGDDALHQPLLIVTSGFHLRRAVLSFRKAGFTNLCVMDADSIGAEADMGAFTWLRYGMWGNMSREAEIMRELIALGYYKIRRWV